MLQLKKLRYGYFCLIFETGKKLSNPGLEFKQPHLLRQKLKGPNPSRSMHFCGGPPARNCTVMNDCSTKKLGISFTAELLCPQLDYLKPQEHTDACSLTGSQPEWLGSWWVIALYALCNGIVHFGRAQWWIRLVLTCCDGDGARSCCLEWVLENALPQHEYHFNNGVNHGMLFASLGTKQSGKFLLKGEVELQRADDGIGSCQSNFYLYCADWYPFLFVILDMTVVYRLKTRSGLWQNFLAVT